MTTRSLVAYGVTITVLGQIGLMLADSNPPPLAVFMLAIGTTLFAHGIREHSTINDEWATEGTIDSPVPVIEGNRSSLALACGEIVLLILLFRLGQGSTSAWDLALWMLGIAMLTMPFVSQARMPQGQVWNRFRWDIAIIASLIILFLVLNVHDLTDWYYSAIGDEYAFYLAASDIIDNGLRRPFSQDGVYGSQPVLNSAYQALVMVIFGQDNFGWRMASLLSIVVAIPGVYVLAHALANRKVAIVSAMLFSLSHYLFAYAHTGYNNVHAIAPTVWSLTCFVLGLQRRNPLFLFAGGIMAGLGFYTHFAARAVVPIILLFVLTDVSWRKRQKELWPFGLGFVNTAAMIFAVSKGEVLSHMLAQVPGGYSKAITGDTSGRIIANATKNLIAFNYNPDVHHYVSGSLLDPVTAVLAILGIGLVFANLRNASSRLLVMWALVSITATGILSPYPQVAISRLNYAVPVLMILAGLAAISIWDVFSAPKSGGMRYSMGLVIGATLFLIVLALNTKRFWFDTPKIFHLTQEAIAIGAMRSDECRGDPEDIIMIARQTTPLLRPALKSYLSEERLPQMFDYDELESGVKPKANLTRCVIFANHDNELAQQAIQELRGMHPDGRIVRYSSPAGVDSVLIFVID